MCAVLPQQLQTTPFRGSSKTPADQGRNPSAVMTAKATRTGMMYIRIFFVFFRSFQFLFPGGKAPKLAVDFHLIDMERFFHAIMGIGHRCCLPAVAPVVLKSEVSAMLKNILSAARQIWNFLP